jgi:hypothetical protein
MCIRFWKFTRPLLRRLGAYAGVPTYLATTLLGPALYGTR